ncbi:hypothetical protein G3567_07955 [Psychroflexus sp. YR1-1]|uniref:PKD domain-containing protein n=1 Tax=Psychroflexus aurantiacus TaxID=2709310 RepID=A0A6B3R0L2_9FLAO|nr:PKD-like domain-containing protein [Psychroflexus aurantiacus]NEV94079.1 hypothetical protein [Psychroflexus aurantiacus]
MKTKLLSSLLIGCLLIIGFVLVNPSNKVNSATDEIAYTNTKSREADTISKSTKRVNSFFEIFTDQSKLALESSDLTINNSLGGAGGYAIIVENGVKSFLRCSSNLSNNGIFEFEDPSQSTYPSGTNYLLDWGDGTTSTQVETHTYSSGVYTLAYSVIFPDGSVDTTEFKVFVGTEPPSVNVQLTGNENCLPDQYEFSVTSTNNTPGTTYTITINDGSEPIILESSDFPLGSSFTETFLHTFLDTSCNTTSFINGSNFPNSFSVTVTATNPCNTSGNFVSTGPIRVSEPTQADFELPADIACVNSTVNFNDISLSGTNTAQDGCNGEYGRYWEISPASGYTLDGGSQLGDNNGNTDWFSWTDGSENLGVIFDTPGYYDITLVTRNNCGESRITKEICIIPEIISEFTLSQDEACFEDNQIVSTTNISQAEGCDIEPTYEWKVEAENNECPPFETDWEFANGTGPEDFEPEFQFNAPGIYIIRLEVSVQDTPGNGKKDKCQNDVYEKVIIIKDKPKAELEDLIVCQNEPFEINPVVYDCYTTSGTFYSWDFSSSSSASIPNSTDPNPTISYDTTGNYTYELTVTNECGSNTYTGNIEVLVPPVVQADGPAEVCANGSIQLNGDISGGTGNGEWSASIEGGTFSPDAGALNPIYSPPNGYAGTIRFTLSSDNSGTLCSEVSDDHEVIVQAEPVVDAGTYAPICLDTSISLEASFGGSASGITWSSSAGGTFSDPTNPNSDFTPPAGFIGTLTLTITTDDPDGPCEETSDSVDVEVLPNGEVNSLPNLEFCAAEMTSEIVFSTPNTSNTTNFEWEIDTNIGLTPMTGEGNIPGFTTENLTENPIVATVSVTPFVKSGSITCPGTPETFTITVKPTPILSDATVDLCPGEELNFTPGSTGNILPAGTTYIWDEPVSTPAGAITGGSAESTPQTSISQPVENSTANAASLVYTVTPILGSCEGETFTLTVNFPEEPVIQDITLDICSGEAFAEIPDEDSSGNQIPAGTQYTWETPVINPSGTITGATAQASPVSSIDQLLENTSSSVSTAVYTVTPVVNGCQGDAFTLTVTVNPEPIIRDYDAVICSGETFSLSPEDISPNRVPAGTQYTWGAPLVSQPGTISGITEAASPQDEIVQSLTSSSDEDVIVTYEVFPEYAACEGNSFFIEIVVQPKPYVEPITQSYCTDGRFTIQPSNTGNNSIPASTTYTWTEPVSNPAGAITGGTAESTPQTEISQNVTNTSQNTATLTYTVIPQSGTCLGDAFTVEIIVESSGLIEGEPEAFQSLCEGGQITPLSIILEGGNSTSSSYQWYRNTTSTNTGGTPIAGATNSTYLPPAFDTPGTFYFYVVVDPEGNQCGDVVSEVSVVEVVEDPTITAQQLDDQDLCLNAPADEMNVAVSGGIGQYNYQWYVNDTADTTTGNAIPSEIGPSFTPPTNQAGTLYYYVVVSQTASGCETTSENARIRIEDQPYISQHPQSEELCLNATPDVLSVNLNFSIGNPTYQWYENNENSSTGGTPIAGENQSTFLPPTDVAGDQFYYVTINFDSSKCGPVVSNPAQLSVVPFAELNPISDLEVCNGDEIAGINFSTTEPGMVSSYAWTNSNTNIGLAAEGSGSIPTFTVTNSTGETQTAVVTVTSESSFSGDPCGQSTQQFTITVASDLEDNAVISDFSGNQTSCFDANDASIQISPSGGIPRSTEQPYLFNWTGPDGFSSNQEDIFNLKQGTYNLEITDGFGCVYKFSYAITAPQELVISEDAVLNIQCYGDFTGKILTSASGGSGMYSYAWLKDGVLIASTQDLENIGAGYYTLIVTDQNNCTAIEDFLVTEPAPIAIEVIEKTALVCTDQIFIPKTAAATAKAVFNGFITIDVQGGTPLQTGTGEFTYRYEWMNSDNQVISTEKDLTGVGPGLYKVNVYDNLGCLVSKEIELVMPEPIDISINSKNETCASSEDGSIALDIEGGTAPYTITWDNGMTGETLSNLAPGTYTANITDKYNCEEVVSVEIEGVTALVMDYTYENISCYSAANGFIGVEIDGGRTFAGESYNYQWTGPNGFTSSEPILNDLDAGTYALVVMDASNCAIDLEVVIEEPAPLEVSYQTTQANCFGTDDGTISLFVEGGTPPYTSNFGTGDSTFLFEGLEPGVYDIEVMDDNGCMEVLEIEIEQDYINDIPPPTGETSQEFCTEDQPRLSDLNVQGMDIQWYLSPTDDQALPDDYLITESEVFYARNYDVDLNCLSSESLSVEVSIIEGIISVNNFITINGNTLNDNLNVVNIESFPENEMKIYNRYGKLVWETTGYNNTDNTFKGASNVGGTLSQTRFLPTGTYYYILNYNSPCRNNTKKGFVQIDNNAK